MTIKVQNWTSLGHLRGSSSIANTCPGSMSSGVISSTVNETSRTALDTNSHEMWCKLVPQRKVPTHIFEVREVVIGRVLFVSVMISFVRFGS